MSKEIARASEFLESAGVATNEQEASERLNDLAAQLEELATKTRGPDHGRIARIQAALDEIQSLVDDDTATTIAEASDELRAYRETIDGV